MKASWISLIPPLLILVASGCVVATPTEDPSAPASPDAPGQSSVAPTPTEGEVIIKEAVVESIAILMLESFPIQVNVVARGNLPDSCTQIGQITQERDDNTFEVTIMTVRPADRVCAAVLVPFEEVIALDVLGLPADSYSVNVNAVTDSFTFDVNNVPQE